MNILTARIGGKTYTAAAISTGLARETIRCMEELDAARRMAQALDDDSGAAEILAAVRARMRCSEREQALICRVFGDRFSSSELEESLSRTELDALALEISNEVGDLAGQHAGGAGAHTEQTASQAMDKLYHTLSIKLQWPVAQIDAADFESLLSFVFYKDPDVRIINGREYRRAVGVPTWL